MEGIETMKRPDLVRAACERFGPAAGNALRFTNETLRAALVAGVAPTGWASEVGSTVPAPIEDEGAALAAAIRAIAAGSATVDEATVRRIAAEEAAKVSAPRSLVVKVGERPAVDVGVTHKQYDRLIDELARGNHVLLTGGAGSGKSHAAKQAAAALGVPFHPDSYCSQTPVSALLGYCDAQGRAVRTRLQEAVEHGGVYLGDEIDAGSPNVTLALNAATSNGIAPFASGAIPVHPDFRVVLTANTTGQGATATYCGRNPLDGAFLDRFVTIHWDYDPALDRALNPGCEEWVAAVHRLRAALDSLPVASRPRTPIGRAIKQGASAARDGVPLPELLDRYVWSHFSATDRATIEGAAR